VHLINQCLSPPPPLTISTPLSLHDLAVVGTLKGYDQLLNLVLDEATEYLRGALTEDTISCHLFPPTLHLFVSIIVYFISSPLSLHLFPLTAADPEDSLRVTEQTRGLGLIVCRGTSVMTVAPSDGTEEIENPFAAAAAAQG